MPQKHLFLLLPVFDDAQGQWSKLLQRLKYEALLVGYCEHVRTRILADTCPRCHYGVYFDGAGDKRSGAVGRGSSVG